MDIDHPAPSTNISHSSVNPGASSSASAISVAMPVTAVNAIPGPFATSDDDESCHSSPTMCPSARRRPRASTVTHAFLRARELGENISIPESILSWVERKTLERLDLGQYITLDKSAPQVRSTISIAFSHDGRFFASTHGDHTVKVFEYPSGDQIACLEGHPRTPWTVRFHPSNSDIIASGCLGNDCRIWNIAEQRCIRKHHFRASISCVSFSPDGELLAVTSGRSLLLWDYMSDTRDTSRRTLDWDDIAQGLGVPQEILDGHNPFHMVDFHPSGHLLMTGEKNRYPSSAVAAGSQPEEQQFTLRLEIHRFDRRVLRKYAQPFLIVPRAVAYNDAGIHFSPCGTMLAACIPAENSPSFRIAVMSLVSRPGVPIGTILYETPLNRGHVTALTNLKFSSTSRHLLAGFSFRPTNPVLRRQAELYDEAIRLRVCDSDLRSIPQVRVVNIYKVSEGFEMIRSLCADMDVSENHAGGTEDEINVAVFAPIGGIADGVVYGTQKGRIRMFRPSVGRMPSSQIEWKTQGLGHVIAIRKYFEDGTFASLDGRRVSAAAPISHLRGVSRRMRFLPDVHIASNGLVFRNRERERERERRH